MRSIETRRMRLVNHERLRLSRNGNPRFLLTFESLTPGGQGWIADTAADSSYNYDVENLTGKVVDFTLNGRDQVDTIEEATS